MSAKLHHTKISVANAKRKLLELIKTVERGETVTIYRAGVPVVDMVLARAHSAPRRKFGTLAGRVVIHDPDRWKPAT